MKIGRILFCVLLFASLGRVSAQVTVQVSTEQDQFLPGEAIPAVVRITNRSGQTLTFGQNPDWLKFSMEARDGYLVMKNGDAPVTGEFSLESSEFANIRVNLAPYFQLSKPGHYTITAAVSIPQWKREVLSHPKGFDLIQGARLWEQAFGVPKKAGDTNSPPEMRRYALQEVNYLRSRITLYAQVINNDGKVDHVLPIGPMISFGQPEPEVDKFSNLHILYQNGPRNFSYVVINPDGELIKRQNYEYTTRPRIMADADGNLAVVGGTRRISRDDVPPPNLSAGQNAPAPTTIP